MNRMRDIAADGPRSLGPARKAKTPRKSSKPTRYPPPAPGSLASSTGSPPGSPLDSSETEEPGEPRRTPTGHAELPHAFRPTPSYVVAAAGVVGGGGVGACSSSRLEEMKPDHPLGAFYPSQFLWGLAASAEASALGRAATVNVIRGPKVAVLPSSSSSAFDASTGTSSGGSGDECSLSPASVGGKRRHHHLQLQQLQLQQHLHHHHHHLHHALSYVDERHHHLAHHHHHQQQYHQQQQQQQHHQQQEQQRHHHQQQQQKQQQQQQQHTSPLPPPSKRARFGVLGAPSEEDSMDSTGTGQGAGPRAGPGQDDDDESGGGASSLQGSDSKVVQQTRRLLANARERTRVHTISAAFEALRQQVPCYSYGQKLSKLAILRIACSYILALAKLANEDYSGEPGGLSFTECVEQCTRTLQAEGRAKKRKE